MLGFLFSFYAVFIRYCEIQQSSIHLFVFILFANLVLLLNISLFLAVQVFDGHGGKHAADFACCHLPKFIVEDEDFPRDIERVVASAFLQTDTAFAEACSLDAALASGTTALAALVVGRLGFLFSPNIHTHFILFKFVFMIF